MSSVQFPVEAGQVMLFARALGDPNPLYYDPDCPEAIEAGGLLAPPTFIRASAQYDPDYAMRPKLGEPWFGSGKEPGGLPPGAKGARGGGGLLAEQQFIYHRPVRVGDVLTATSRPGKTWEKQGRRAGKLVFTETITEYRTDVGELVLTAVLVGVRTERPATEAGSEEGGEHAGGK